MTESEVVGTAYAAVKMAMDHEIAELFKWKGVAIYDHHLSVDSLRIANTGGRMHDKRAGEL